MSTDTILAIAFMFFVGWIIGVVCGIPDENTGETFRDSAMFSFGLATAGAIVVMIVAVTRFLVLL